MFQATYGTAISWQKLDDISPVLAPLALVQVPACLADGAVSLAVDTVLLPYDGYQQDRARADAAFWDAFFAGETPLPAVAVMRQHVTRHSVARLARQAEYEGTDEGTRFGYGRGQTPATANQAELRSARLDRLIEAELVLAAVARRDDLTPAQVARLIPYAEQRRDVRLALLSNPATPVETLDRWLMQADSAEFEALARNPAIPAAWAERLFQQGAPEILRRLAENPGLPRQLVERLAGTDYSRYWFLVVRRRDLPDACVRQFSLIPWAGASMVAEGRDDLSPDVLRTILAAQPAAAQQYRQQTLTGLRRQHHAPPDLLQLAWDAQVLSVCDLPGLANTSPEVGDWAAGRIAECPTFCPAQMTALIPRLGESGLRVLRQRVETEWHQAESREDQETIARCRVQAERIDARLRELSPP